MKLTTGLLNHTPSFAALRQVSDDEVGQCNGCGEGILIKYLDMEVAFGTEQTT